MRAIETSVGDATVFVEVTGYHLDVVAAEDAVSAAGAGDKAAKLLAQAGVVISDACADLVARIKKAGVAARPNELEVAFSLALSAEGGWGFIAKGKGEATIEVTAKWVLEENAG